MADRGRGRPGSDRARRDPRHGVGRVPMVRGDLRRRARRLLQRRRTTEGHGHRRRLGRGALRAAAHDEPLPRRRRRRLRARGGGGVQQLPPRGVLRARPEAADRPPADPVARHRHVDRRAPQGQGPWRQGRRDLELAVGRVAPLSRRRSVLGRRVRRRHAGLGAHQHHQPLAARGRPEGRGEVGEPAVPDGHRGRRGPRRSAA